MVILRTATPAMSRNVRGKRPRPQETSSDFDAPATAIRRKDGMATVAGFGSSPVAISAVGSAGEGSAYRKGMFLAFIDDAFLQRNKVSLPLLPSPGPAPDTASSAAPGAGIALRGGEDI